MNHNQKTPIVILHGWRVGGSRYSVIKQLFEKNGYQVFAPDLPGTGDEKVIKEVMTVDDYVYFVLEFFKKQKISKAILICHSFGGRIGAKLASSYPEKVEKLVLTGTPLIKKPLSLRKKTLSTLAIYFKRILKSSFGETRLRKVLYYLLGEWDYVKVPKELRETFKAIIKEDISPNLPKIPIPTLVIWGEKDTFVSRKIGQEIAKTIPNASYKEIKGASHKLPYEYPQAFVQAVLDFVT